MNIPSFNSLYVRELNKICFIPPSLKNAFKSLQDSQRATLWRAWYGRLQTNETRGQIMNATLANGGKELFCPRCHLDIVDSSDNLLQ